MGFLEIFPVQYAFLKFVSFFISCKKRKGYIRAIALVINQILRQTGLELWEIGQAFPANDDGTARNIHFLSKNRCVNYVKILVADDLIICAAKPQMMSCSQIKKFDTNSYHFLFTFTFLSFPSFFFSLIFSYMYILSFDPFVLLRLFQRKMTTFPQRTT